MSNNADRRWTVVVVGGGFSGAAVAFHLLSAAAPGTEIVLVEPAAELARGLAYSTPSDSHRLNVPAGRLGLDARRESGFVDWLRSQGLPYGPPDFAPRRWLGSYVSSELERAAAQTRADWRRVGARVESLSREQRRLVLRLSDGELLMADKVVLATGHLPTEPPPFAGSLSWSDDGMVPDPWRGGSLARVPAGSDVLLVGSGLTAIDVVSQLRDDGHRGRIHLLSRRGLLPQPHRVNEARPPAGLSPVAELGEVVELRRALSAVHAWVDASVAVGGDWRDVMASLRPCTPHIWQRLGPRDRRQFLRHLQPFWDTHRHRLAPAVNARLQAWMAQGEVQVDAGRLVGVDRLGDGQLDVRWRARGQAEPSRFTVSRVVNCTGPTANLARARDPLLASLRDAGLLCADDLGQGLRVDEALRPLDASGAATPGLYYVGPMLKARFWESVAVPELRVHARHVAAAILAELERPAGEGVPAVPTAA